MKLRVAAIQYHLHSIHSFDEFSQQVKHYIKTAAEFDAEFMLFPELFTTQLLSIGDDARNPVIVDDLDLTLLKKVRQAGAVTTWRDRRTDLYPDW